MNKFRWEYLEYSINHEKTKEFAEVHNISPVLSCVCLNRNIEDFNSFTSPDKWQFYSPYLLNDMQMAVDLIKKTISEGKKITIYGDYDVDGMLSTTILKKYLRTMGANVDYYIPNRIDEGYGINLDAIKMLKETGTSLVITVDTGITAAKEIEYAKEIGLDFIVTDHHECKDDIPKDVPIINPKRTDSKYPFCHLAGVGVVFKLISALNGNCEEIFAQFGDLIALGTVADVVSLRDENRHIVLKGLEIINNTKNIGLKALIDVAIAPNKKVSVNEIGYLLAPRINAAGRTGCVSMAIELFMCEDEQKAHKLAEDLCNENTTRRQLEKEIFDEVSSLIESNKEITKDNVIVIWGDNWHHGVIGIVASRISEKYSKPCILITFDDDDIGKGSGRSIKGFNLFNEVKQFSDYLEKFGGHSLAIGLTIKRENIWSFSHRMKQSINSATEGNLTPFITIDSEMPMEYLTEDTMEELNILEPFGTSNEAPMFSITNARVKYIKTLSDGKHIKIILQKKNTDITVIGFHTGHLVDKLSTGVYVDVAGTLSLNVFKDMRNVQLTLKDIRFSSVPTRDDIAAVFCAVRDNTANNLEDIVTSTGVPMLRAQNSIKILQELGVFLIDENIVSVVPNVPKQPLTNSALYNDLISE